MLGSLYVKILLKYTLYIYSKGWKTNQNVVATFVSDQNQTIAWSWHYLKSKEQSNYINTFNFGFCRNNNIKSVSGKDWEELKK